MFGFLLAFVLTFFLCGELMLSRDNPTGSGTCTTWNTGWERVFADGSREAIELDSKCDAERGEVVRLEKRLPMAPESTWYCMRASQQDMRIYVEEELRKEYSTAETRWFGKDSASAFVFFEIEAADAGKMLAVELVSNCEYAGFLNEMYVGDKYDIAATFIKECASVLTVSILMLIVSLCTIVVGIVLRVVYKKKVPVTYLGAGVFQLALAMIVESRVRQFFMPNLSVAYHVGFFLTMLIPYPFMVYVNLIQKNRYIKVYRALSLCVAMNFVISTLLQVLGLVDMGNSTWVAYVLIMAMVLLMGFTIACDLMQGRRDDYGFLLWGIVTMLIVTLIETYVTFVPIMKLNGGFALSVGLIILLLMAAYKTAEDILELEVMRKTLALRLDEKIKEASELKSIAQQDTLTGLWNRTYTEERVAELLKTDKKGALFMMDLDNFKGINDKYGHIVGDACLKTLADVVVQNVKDEDVVCRIGGDEFMVYITGSDTRHALEICAASIIARMSEYFVREKFETNSSVSIGIAEFPNDGKDFTSLYSAADKALYHVKQNGKNAFHFYSDQRQAERERAGRNIDLNYLRDIMKRTDPNNGSYLVDYDNFHHIYNFIRRTVERSDKDVQTVLFTVEEGDLGVAQLQEVEKAIETLECAVFQSLRRVDVSARYSARQFVVVLVDTNEENGKKVVERILAGFKDIYDGELTFTYDIVKM